MAVDTLFLCFLEGNDIKKSSARKTQNSKKQFQKKTHNCKLNLSFNGIVMKYQDNIEWHTVCPYTDLDRNDGTPSKPYFMSKGLLNVVGKMNQLNEMQMRATEDWTDTSTTPIKVCSIFYLIKKAKK